MMMGLLDKKKMVASIVGSEKSESTPAKEYSDAELKAYAKEGLMSKFISAVQENEAGRALHALEKLIEMCSSDKPENPDY